MRFSEIATRLTGISTPIFGVSWTPAQSDVDAVRRTLVFLEDRRVLYAPERWCEGEGGPGWGSGGKPDYVDLFVDTPNARAAAWRGRSVLSLAGRRPPLPRRAQSRPGARPSATGPGRRPARTSAAR